MYQLPGGYKCSCPKGHHGNSLKNGTHCSSDHSEFVTRFSLEMLAETLCRGSLSSMNITLYVCEARYELLFSRLINTEKITWVTVSRLLLGDGRKVLENNEGATDQERMASK
ncbi:uncharacterized protein LOC125496105 isoform X2 [Beta vulgaris subsp. vulgaris]|uniref:uncharacterized protein LOC125496105 isoform X2 n=1 Tax=Beta vulgaris subsp. vulgaris TaxID=3555 RepID=UPI0025496053|nr:uncharacterized protein LOC125496105 isoform X2 [Beta vulgaris subsp. vulgaris]